MDRTTDRTFSLAEVARRAATELHRKLQDNQHNIRVDASVLEIPILMGDRGLATVAKTAFGQLPLPVRNLVLATGECETEFHKVTEAHLESHVRTFVSSLERASQSMHMALGSLEARAAQLTGAAKAAWQTDLEAYSADVTALQAAVAGLVGREGRAGKDRLGSADRQDPYEAVQQCIADLERARLAARKTDRKAAAAAAAAPPNVAGIGKRLAASETFRHHATALASDFKLSDVDSLPRLDVAPTVEAPPMEEAPVQPDPRPPPANAAMAEDLMAEAEKLKGLMHQAWIPHRKAIADGLRRAVSSYVAACNQVCDDLRSMPLSPLPSMEPLVNTKDLLKKEFQYVIPTFPCDASALRTCVSVIVEGAKVAHVRKLCELKTEATNALNTYMWQMSDMLVRYHEAARPPMML